MDPTVAQVIELLKINGVAVLILFFAAWFLATRFWPWYTKDYFPSQQAARTRAEIEQTNLRNAIAALTATVQALPATMASITLTNVQQGVAPQLELVASQIRADLDRAREASVTATGSRLDALAQAVGSINTIL